MSRKGSRIPLWRVCCGVRYPQRLRSVVTRQEICASRFELWDELFRELQFDLRLRSSEYPEKPRQTKWWTVLDYFRVWCVCQLFCFSEGVVQFTKTVYQFVLQCFFARENSAIGDSIAQMLSRQISLFRDDTEKFVVGAHNEILHELPFFRRDRSRSVEHVFKFSALKDH